MLNQVSRKKIASDGGFTLIELLVVIIILGILSAIVVVAVANAKTKSSLAACQANQVQMLKALDLYKTNTPYATATGGYPTGWGAGGVYSASTLQAALNSSGIQYLHNMPPYVNDGVSSGTSDFYIKVTHYGTAPNDTVTVSNSSTYDGTGNIFGYNTSSACLSVG